MRRRSTTSWSADAVTAIAQPRWSAMPRRMVPGDAYVAAAVPFPPDVALIQARPLAERAGGLREPVGEIAKPPGERVVGVVGLVLRMRLPLALLVQQQQRRR